MTFSIIALQCLILTYAVLACFAMQPPRMTLAGLVFSGLVIVSSGTASGLKRARWAQCGFVALMISTLVLLVLMTVQRHRYAVCTFENASAAGLVAMAILGNVRLIFDPVPKRRWLAGFAVWAFLCTVAWLGAGHVSNQRLAFYAGLLICVMLLVFSKRWFPLPNWGILVINTLVLLCIVLPLFSALSSPAEHFDVLPTLEERPYSYEVARKDPAKFARWSRLNREEGLRFFNAILSPSAAFRLNPNTVAKFFDSEIAINSKGFRGHELPAEKGNAYRIVALGESTTFGITMSKEDRPWPEILEHMIRERLKPTRPVQVINAGIPGASLTENVSRLPNEIMQLQPDMILSYHGYNGFGLIYRGMPKIHGKPPPIYRPRPIKLLADLEYAVAVRKYRKDFALRAEPRPAYVSSPLETEYARLYRQLITFAKSNNVQVALATYSMAVNHQSPSDVIEFYGWVNIGAEWQIKANLAHSIIVQELAQEHPDICFIDTRPHLDGNHDMYYDLVHFTAEGQQQMAELFFAGIRTKLEKDLAESRQVVFPAGRQLRDGISK